MSFFWHVKDFGDARDRAAEGFKPLPTGMASTGNDALTNGPMSSRAVPTLNISIILSESRLCDAICKMRRLHNHD